MKAIVRYLILLLLVCGTALAWKGVDRRYRNFSGDASRQKEEGEAMQAALQPVLQSGISSKALATWSKSEFQGRLEEAFEKGDPCAVIETLQQRKDAAPRDFWSAGMAVLLGHTGESSALLEELLASRDSPFYGQAKEESRSKEGRFFNALIYSGQLQGIDEEEDQPRRGPRNNDRAIEIFKELIQEDPDNGAYSYFLATALRQSGAKKEEVHAALGQASRTPKFDAFYQGIFDQLQKLAYGNAATFTWAYSFLESMPAPDYAPGIRYLKYWAGLEEPGKWTAHRFAKRLVEVGAKFKSGSPGYQFSRKEYMLGQNLKFTVEGKQEKSWKEYNDHMQESHAFISETPRPVVEAEISLFGERIVDDHKRSCAPEAWKSLFAAYKAKSET